jgi:hypothetical protein
MIIMDFSLISEKQIITIENIPNSVVGRGEDKE